MALTINRLSKTYPNGVTALKSLSPSIGNSIFGLVGLTQPSRLLSIRVDQPPTLAGIDPYNKLIDRNADDNTIAVTKQ